MEPERPRTATSGEVTATSGEVTATSGEVTATSGEVTALVPASSTGSAEDLPPPAAPPRCCLCRRRCCPDFSLPCHVMCTSCLKLLVSHRDSTDVILCPRCGRIYLYTEQWMRFMQASCRNDHLHPSAGRCVRRCQRCSLQRGRGAGGGGGGGVGRPASLTPFAEHYCYQCQQALCRHCHRERHLSITSQRSGADPLNHIVVPLLPPDWMFWNQDGAPLCYEHGRDPRPVTVFCVTCSVLLCTECAADVHDPQRQDWETHEGHEQWDVGNTLRNVRNVLLARLAALEAHKAVLQRLLVWLSSLLEGINSDFKEASVTTASNITPPSSRHAAADRSRQSGAKGAISAPSVSPICSPSRPLLDADMITASLARRRREKKFRLLRTMSASSDKAAPPSTARGAGCTRSTVQASGSQPSAQTFALSVWNTNTPHSTHRAVAPSTESSSSSDLQEPLGAKSTAADTAQTTLAGALARLCVVTHYFPVTLTPESARRAADDLTADCKPGPSASAGEEEEATAGRGPCSLQQPAPTAAQSQPQDLSAVPPGPQHQPQDLSAVPTCPQHQPQDLSAVPPGPQHQPQDLSAVPTCPQHQPQDLSAVPTCPQHQPQDLSAVPPGPQHQPQDLSTVPPGPQHQPQDLSTVPPGPQHQPQDLSTVPPGPQHQPQDLSAVPPGPQHQPLDLSAVPTGPQHQSQDLEQEMSGRRTKSRGEFPADPTPASQPDSSWLAQEEDAGHGVEKDRLLRRHGYSNRTARHDELSRPVKAAFPGDSLSRNLRSLQTSYNTLESRVMRLCYELYNQDPSSLCCLSVWINARSVITERACRVLKMFFPDSQPSPTPRTPASSEQDEQHHAGSGPSGSAEGYQECSSGEKTSCSASSSRTNGETTRCSGGTRISQFLPVLSGDAVTEKKDAHMLEIKRNVDTVIRSFNSTRQHRQHKLGQRDNSKGQQETTGQHRGLKNVNTETGLIEA